MVPRSARQGLRQRCARVHCITLAELPLDRLAARTAVTGVAGCLASPAPAIFPAQPSAKALRCARQDTCLKLLVIYSLCVLHRHQEHWLGMQSSLHSWDSTKERSSAKNCGYSFVSPAEKGLWYQSWSLAAGNVGDQVSDRLVGDHSSCLQVTQPTDKPASRCSPTVLVLSSICLHRRGTVADALLCILVSLLDSTSSDFVFGPIATEGRPPRALSVEMLDMLGVGQLLSCAERHRWHQVSSVWHVAG